VTSTGAEAFDSGSLSAGSFSHTFATPGTFGYLCIWHPGMTGTITVVAAAPAPGAATTTPGASTPGAAGAPQTAQPKLALVARPGRPRLARVRVSGRQLHFRLSESATVVAFAFRPHSSRGIRIGSVVAAPGAGTLDLRFDRLHPARYALVVRATDRSRTTRFGYLLTRGVWQRAVDARRVPAKIPPIAAPAVPPTTAPIAPPAVAPAATGTATPVSPSDDGDHEDDSGSNRSGSNTSGGNRSGTNTSGSNSSGTNTSGSNSSGGDSSGSNNSSSGSGSG